MTKVTPVTSTTDKSQNYGPNDVVSDLFEENDNENTQLIQSHPQKLMISCPIRLFLMTTLSILIIVCAVTVYLAVFVGMYSSVDELTNKMIHTVQGQVTNYIDRFLGDLKMSSKLAAGLFNNGLIAKKDYRQYLYQGFNNSGVFVGYFLQVNNHSERFSYVIINGNFLYTYQDNGFPGLIRDKVNMTTAQVIKYNFTVSSAPQNLETTEFYTSAISESNSLGVEGVFGKPFYVVGGAISLPYATKLYNSTMYPVKKLIGICRATIPLYLLSEYLSGVKVFEKGYVVLTELNSTVAVGGSIKTTTDDGSNNLSIFNLTQNNAGQLMTDISNNYQGIDNIPSKFSVYSMGTKYIVTVSNYKFDNLVWRMFIIAFDEDISLTTNLSIGISIGVSILIIIIGIIYSLILSKMITRTVKYLEEQLMHVKVFDLEKVTISSSMFKEMNLIIDNLQTTVQWLKQVKPFIPATVFYHIQSSDLGEENEQVQESNKQQNGNAQNRESKNGDVRGSSSLDSKTKSSSLSLNKDANSLFKMGLSKKTCAILHITFNKFELQTTHTDISVTLSKVSTMIRNIANIHQAHFQINSSEDIIIVIDQKSNKKHPSEIALECSLKITNIILSTNNLLKENDLNGLDFFIGISTSDNSHVGNIGSNSFRFFSFISNSRKIALNLALLASSLGVRILLDEETFKNTNQKFITKPVDRILLEGSIHSSQVSDISNVYELVKETAVAQDEWLYELNNLNSNKELESLNGVFSIFKDVPQDKILTELDSYLALINSYLEKTPNDIAVSNLLEILDYYKKACGNSLAELPARLRNYCKKVNYQITTTK